MFGYAEPELTADFEQRLALLERALSTSLDMGRKCHNEAMALRIVLQTLLSNLIDEGAEESLEWLDDLEQAASENVYGAVDYGIFSLSERHRLDSLTMDVTEEDRELIQSQIRELFAPLKNAQLAKLESVE